MLGLAHPNPIALGLGLGLGLAHPNPNANLLEQVHRPALVPVSGLGRRFSALGGPLEGLQVALKRLGALPRIRRGAQGRGRGREGSGALLLPRAAAVSTGLRVHH